MASKVEHSGVVIGIEGHFVNVALNEDVSCEGCKIKSICGRDADKRVLSIYCDNFTLFSLGDHVNVLVSSAYTLRATLFLNIIPMVLMLGVILSSNFWTTSELYAALSALGVMVLYFFVLFLFRKRLERQIIYEIIKI